MDAFCEDVDAGARLVAHALLMLTGVVLAAPLLGVWWLIEKAAGSRLGRWLLLIAADAVIIHFGLLPTWAIAAFSVFVVVMWFDLVSDWS